MSKLGAVALGYDLDRRLIVLSNSEVDWTIQDALPELEHGKRLGEKRVGETYDL